MATQLPEQDYDLGPILPLIHEPPRQLDIARAKWWLSYIVVAALLASLDCFLSFWHPFPSRLPEQFSPAFLKLYVADAPTNRPVITVLGDSVLWGYKLAPEDTAIYRLQAHSASYSILNLSYEGGSTPNSEVMLRFVLSSHIKPQAVIVNLNVKEFNANDSAYRTLHPSLEAAAQSLLTNFDRRTLTTHLDDNISARIGYAVDRVWRFYRLRTDLREALFHTDDAATVMVNSVQHITGSAQQRDLEHRPTPDKFLGTYDLTPLDRTNVAFQYYEALVRNLCANHINAFVFLTPTNHVLLHDYIDAPEYDAILRTLLEAPHCRSVRLVNLDRAIPARYFIDNDHLNAQGQKILASKLQREIAGLLK